MKITPRPVHGAFPRPIGMLLLTALFLVQPACKTPVEPPPTLAELKIGAELKASGKKLIHIPLGTHRLTEPDRPSTRAVLAVHGYGSRGYEWVTALHQFSESGAHVYWLRWDWNQCPESGLTDLQKGISKVQTENPGLEEIQIFGHSYGGILGAMFAQKSNAPIKIHAHIIASPLAGMGKLKRLCPETGIAGQPPKANINLTQWRTQHHVDGAFKDEAVDPQVVSLPGARIVQLPDTFNGRRLGHNWSVSYVATQWLAESSRPASPTEAQKPKSPE